MEIIYIYIYIYVAILHKIKKGRVARDLERHGVHVTSQIIGGRLPRCQNVTYINDNVYLVIDIILFVCICLLATLQKP